ncbi:MAG: flagellar basal body-associated FliL family protein [Cellulomonas sp.]|nr:flagellar basal body-associated FliL family protein [Cellulomonas sp.]
MPVEQRVVSRQKIGARAATAPPPPAPTEPEPARPRRRRRAALLVAVAVVLLAAAVAAGWFLYGRGAGASVPEPTAEPGEVAHVEAISVNLADGHYLRLGLGLQLTADAHGAPDPAPALDAAIALFSGRTIAEVQDPVARDALTAELVTVLQETYDGEVMDVYLTNYVTQ